MRGRLVLLALLGILSIGVISRPVRTSRPAASHGAGPASAAHFDDPPPVHGLLRFASVPGDARSSPVSRAAPPPALPGGAAPAPAASRRLLRSEFVNGPSYSGMEDNDLRGYLDGVFKYAWNQTTQVHVRIGRRDSGPRFGEYEIFRVLHRWAGVRLPAGARVVNAELRLHVETGPASALRLFLYDVRKDWDPGRGGSLHDNVSPPVPGEVWWNDVAFAESSWALPGVGFASEDRPEADTGAMPLAGATWEPGANEIVFTSAALADYATRRATAGLPLLFLLKVSDPLEDTPGSVLTVYSGNCGDSRNVARRPRLVLEWIVPERALVSERVIHLEHGRTLELPAIETRAAAGFVPAPATFFASFFPEAGSLDPTLEVRTGSGSDTTDWTRFTGDAAHGEDWIQARVIAATDPIPIGDSFRAELADTWIRTASPQEQHVPWVFTAPSGKRHEVAARYAGESRWEVEFTPDELGEWAYSWRQNFDVHHFDSGEAFFDVIGGGLENVVRRLNELAAAASGADRKDAAALGRRMAQFARLERAAMAALTPDQFAGAAWDSTRAALRRVREALGHEAVPDSLPMVPDGPPEWKRKANGK